MLVQTLFAGPMTIVGNSVADVFHGRAAALAREAPERVARLFMRTAGVLSGVAIPVGAAVVLLAPSLFPLVFGEQWQTAGYAAAALAPRMVVHMVVGPLSRIVFVYEGQKSKLIFDAVVLTLTIASLAAAKLLDLPFVTALAVLAWADLAAYGLYAGILWSLIPQWSVREGG